MADPIELTVSIGDKVFCGSYESVQPEVSLKVSLHPGEEPEGVIGDMLGRVGELWEKALVLRLNAKLRQHEQHMGPPLDPWIYKLHDQLRAKHYGEPE